MNDSAPKWLLKWVAVISAMVFLPLSGVALLHEYGVIASSSLWWVGLLGAVTSGMAITLVGIGCLKRDLRLTLERLQRQSGQDAEGKPNTPAVFEPQLRQWLEAQSKQAGNTSLTQDQTRMTLLKEHRQEIQNRMMLMHEITKEVSKVLDFRHSIHVFLTKLVDSFWKMGCGSVFLFDRANREFELFAWYQYGMEHPLPGESLIHEDDFPLRTQFERQQAVLMNEALEFSPELNLPVRRFLTFDQQLVVPLRMQEQVVGLLVFSLEQAHHTMSQDDLTFCDSLLSGLSYHFNNAAMHEDLRSKDQDISRLNDVLQLVNQTLNLEEIINRVMRRFKIWYGFDAICVPLVKFESMSFQLSDHYIDSSGTIGFERIKSATFSTDPDNLIGRCILFNEFYRWEADQNEGSRPDFKIPLLNEILADIKSLLIFPMEIQGIVIGCMMFMQTRETLPLGEQVQQSLTRLIRQFASGLRTSYLYDRIILDKQELEQAYEQLKLNKIQLVESEKVAALKEVFERFVPKQFLQRISTDGLLAIMPGYCRQEEISILFGDIRNYTFLSEKMQIRDNYDFINEYLIRMEPCVANHNGFIDKFMGDAVMALYDREGQSAYDAINSAIEMQREIDDLNMHRKRDGKEAIRIGIAINTGPVMMGVIGTERRMDSTVIGDHVNLTSRLESLSKVYNSKILISGFTHAQIKHEDYLIREVDTVKVRGRQQPVTIYEVFDVDDLATIEHKLQTRDLLLKGLVQFKMQEFDEAIETFRECQRIYPNDVVTNEYIKRSEFMKKYPPETRFWDGVMQDTGYDVFTMLKRRSPRFKKLLPLNIYTKESKKHFAANSLDFAKSGIKIETNVELEVYDTLLLEIFLDKETLEDYIKQNPLHIMGQVVWKKQVGSDAENPVWNMGVEYIMMDNDDEKLMKKYLLKLANLPIGQDQLFQDMLPPA